MGNTDPNNTKAGKQIRGQASVRKAIKTANHETCYNQCLKCMRAIKDRIARPVDQLANNLSQPLYPHGVSTGEIIGTTHQSANHNVDFNQVIDQSVNQAQDVCMYANQHSIHNAYNSIPVGLFGGFQQMEEFSRSVVDLFSAGRLFRGNQQIDSSRANQQLYQFQQAQAFESAIISVVGVCVDNSADGYSEIQQMDTVKFSRWLQYSFDTVAVSLNKLQPAETL
ncbi:hypothetical protein F511_26775 [Dorcoceras hygrometricum]|uniref:Uncharacterized protein n=1 Tax=Dorcoceras hygrometricum TaxID=472368 RepID=A0A2Z7CEU6_9LAMI|nr:hypothetical protein F511_26775 [Dorcoceras hygrometricum]